MRRGCFFTFQGSRKQQCCAHVQQLEIQVSSTYQIWAVTDGRAGNRAQALGLAEAVTRRRSAQIAEKEVTLKSWASPVPPVLSWRLSGVMGWPLLGIKGDGHGLIPPWPDLLIGAGRRVGPIVAELRRRHRVPAVQLLSPQMPIDAFDYVIVPQHDTVSGANVLTTVGALNRLTPDTIKSAADAWQPPIKAEGRTRLAVLLGGPSRSSGFGVGDIDRIRDALSALATEHTLLITPSRRTPPELVNALSALPQSAWCWDGTGENPYPGLLGHADAVLVTEDSVNMASEAATTGLPVYVLQVSDPAQKIQRFHASLRDRGASRPFDGAIASWTYAPLSEADRIAGDLIDRGLIPD